MNLYHGTNQKSLSSILQFGLEPRGDKTGNWKHTIDGRRDSVYLTSTYGLYFASCAVKEHHSDAAIVLEIDTTELENLHADEDAIEQATRGKDKLVGMSMEQRTVHYRDIATQYDHEISLKILGTCAHLGTIPISCIKRVVVVDRKKLAQIIMKGMDPSISILNHQFCGDEYRQLNHWLFNGDSSWVSPKAEIFAKLSGSIDLEKLTVSRDGIKVYTVEIDEAGGSGSYGILKEQKCQR